MSDYPMLISNKLHSFRNFYLQANKQGSYMRLFKTSRMVALLIHLTMDMPSLSKSKWMDKSGW